MHQLQKLLIERIGAGLKRSTIDRCSVWSERYRVMGVPFPGPWSFKYHPWAREMCDCEAEVMVGQKSAQAGYTEVALNKVFFNLDVHGRSAMYLLPALHPDASDFSSARFSPALELSPHLQSIFTNTNNVGHKRAGTANLYIRGSRSRSQLKSAPVSLMVFDEVDEMVQENLPLAKERMSGQLWHQELYISTPTLPNFGINAYYESSTQEHFFFECPHCSKLIELKFPESLVITADSITDPDIENTHIICTECKTPLDHNAKPDFLSTGRFVPTYKNRNIRGFHVNQMYSSTIRPAQLAESYLKSLTNPTDEQEFYNSKLGLVHIVKGARVDDDGIQKAIGGYASKDSSKGIVTMGVDIGKYLHYQINEWRVNENLALKLQDLNLGSHKRMIKEGKLLEFEELDLLMHRYNVLFCVVDANPERRKALEFARRFYGHVRLCIYGNSVNGKNIHVHDQEQHMITVDRTNWLDLTLARLMNDVTISIPFDTSEEWKAHHKALVRVYQRDKDGNPVGKWENGYNDDHFAHADNYSEIALPLATALSENRDITGIL